jgi:hypothetical protein
MPPAQEHHPEPATSDLHATGFSGLRRSSNGDRSHNIQSRVCIDPQMHSAESHAPIHHPGLVEGADFCDAGVEEASDVEIQMPEKS